MSVDPRDEPFSHYRAKFSDKPPYDGRTFWLAMTRAEDGLVSYRWDLDYATRAEALSAADALVRTGSAYAVFITEQIGVVRREK